jgi:hypothetical protein
VRLNNTLTRLLAVLLLMAVIKATAIPIDPVLTHVEPSREDPLVKYGYGEPEKSERLVRRIELLPVANLYTPSSEDDPIEEPIKQMPNIITLPPEEYEPEGQNKNKKIPTFQEFMVNDGSDLTPEEYNSYRNKYKSDYLGKIAEKRYGPKPNKNVTEWQTAISNEESRLDAVFDKRFPAKKVDTAWDIIGNYGHAAASGIIKSLRLFTRFGGKDNAASLTLTRVIATHQDAMTETERIEAQRATKDIEYASEVSPLTGLRARLKNIRATWVVEALIVPLILLGVIFFRKIQYRNWPKLPAFKRPNWPTLLLKMVWTKVPIGEARKHRKYGIKNGLIILIIYLVLSPLAIWGSLNNQLWEARVTHSEFFSRSDSAAMVVFQLLISLVMAGIVLWAMFTKQPKFRRIGTTVFASYFPVFFLLVLIFPNVAMGQAIAQGLIKWLIFGGLWVLYLQRSQRVRVTFEHTIKTPRPNPVGPTDEPTQAPPQAASQIAIKMPTALATEASSQALEPKNIPSSPTAIHSTPVRTVSEEPQSTVADEDEFLWSQALTELDGSDRKNGLWAQCYAAHNGHEPAARADYLKKRVGQLRNVRQTPHT